MYLGIDVGGTHTDAVAMFNGEVAASCKVKTNHNNLLASIRAALDDVLGALKGVRITRLNLSTTLSTNAIVEGKTENVGVLVSAGPGIDPDYFHIGRCYHVIPGAIDHRGFEVKALNLQELDASIACCRQMSMRVWAVVSKFSTRNPAHEQAMLERLAADADHVSLGHRLSGLLNFPRRIATAYYNAAVWRLYNSFADAIEKCLREYNIDAPVNILKADGGTMPLSRSRELPVESILSGPAASVMGIIALCEIRQDCVILDIGGTTTDIAFFAEGAPIIETAGIEVGSYPTLVRAMKTHSIGIGGDSRIHLVEHKVFVGPEREGPSMAMGGTTPTLIDACNYLKLASVADRQASVRGVENLASLWDISPKKLAQQAVRYAVETIKATVDDLVWSINQKPVYTIGELLSGKELRPRRAYCMGGPAMTFQPLLAEAFGLEVVVPENYAVANAIGAALTRTSLDLELFADSNKGVLFIPNLGVEKTIPASYTLEDAEREAKQYLVDYLKTLDVHDFDNVTLPIDTTEAVSFNMVDDVRGSGKNIRVKCQIRPGVMR